MKRVAIILLLMCMLALPAHATSIGEIAQQMPQSARELAGVEQEGEGNLVSKFATKLWGTAVSAVRDSLRAATRASFLILAICALAGIVQSFATSANIKLPVNIIKIAAVIAIAIISVQGAGSVITEIGKSLAELKIMLHTLMPAFTVATATAGSPIASVATSAATMFFASTLITVGEKVIFPAAYLFILIYAAAQITGNQLIIKVPRLIKWSVMACYKIALTLFTIYITMTGVLSGGADVLATKAARVTISGVVPVLGGILADSADTLLAGATMLKNSIGVFGMAAAVAVCLLPFVRALSLMMAFKITAAIGGSIAGGNVSQMLEGVADSYSILVGLLASCCAAVFIVIIVCTTVVR